MPAHYRLRIKSLKFISAVDAGAQGPIANVALIKRAPGGASVEATCRVIKTDEKLGLVFGWALASSLTGGATPHVDLQNDAIVGDDELIKVAAAFVEAGAASDVLHDESPDGRVIFCMPLTKDVNAALGIKSDVHGLAIAMRPSPETFKRFLSKELNAFSIGGIGERELAKAADTPACPSCGAYGKADDKDCAKCGKAMKRATKPKSVAARPPKRLIKRAVLTGSIDGHQHAVDLDDPADEWRDSLSTSYQVAEGASVSHCHAWTFDPNTGKITIADDSGHAHPIEDVVPDDVRAKAALMEDGERCPSCHELCDEDCKFCPSCGAAMDRSNGAPCAASSDEDSDSHGAVVVIAARAPGANSSPSDGTPTVKSETKEPDAMADNTELQALKAENALLKSMATLTDAQRAHHNKLIAKGVKSNADAFLALTPAQRDTELQELAKADEVVYTSKSHGRAYRKSDALEIIEAAREFDAMADLRKRLETERTELEFSKRGDATLAHFAKGGKQNLRGRIMKAIAAEFTDAAEYAEAERAMKSADFALQESLSGPKGVNPHLDAVAGDSPAARFNAAVADFAKRNNISIAQAMERGTATDPEIRKLYNEASGAGN